MNTATAGSRETGRGGLDLVESADDTVCQEKTSVLFVTDEIFLPQVNGSAQVYTSLARQYRNAGHDIFCLSFFRDDRTAFSSVTRDAYRGLFRDCLIVPGWNRGGGCVGAIGMAWRELSRWSTGNVFATHPFLSMTQAKFADPLLAMIARNNIGLIYCHKPHTLLLLEPVLPRLRGVRIAVDIHDDFVARDQEYAAAYASVFGALPWRSILGHYAGMYARQRCSHTNRGRSRRREMSLLQWCDDIFVASDREYGVYAALPGLEGRVRHQPWPYGIDLPASRADDKKPFDAGFIGADNVMNLDAVLNLRDNILPRIHARHADFRMLLAGTMTRTTRTLLRGVPGIETWDRLEQVAAFYAAVGTAAVPIRHGTGVSVKAIEALAHGCRLVTTSMGVRGLPAVMLRRPNVTIADDPAVFAAALAQGSSAISDLDLAATG